MKYHPRTPVLVNQDGNIKRGTVLMGVTRYPGNSNQYMVSFDTGGVVDVHEHDIVERATV